MIVAVIAVRVVQPVSDKIIHMISMRHGCMPAGRTMHMFSRMALSAVGAFGGVRFVHFNHMFVHMVSVDVMEVPVV